MSSSVNRSARRSRPSLLPKSSTTSPASNPSLSGTAPRPRREARVTPRNSIAGTGDTTDEPAPKETPHANLRQLAGLIHRPTTPLRTLSDHGGASTRRSIRRTPSAQARTPRPGGALRPIPTKRGAPATPHAIRALQQRRAAALTPGAERRRSGRVQRETPRDTLRALSKVLAPRSRPVESSPPELPQTSRRISRVPEDDLDLGPDLPAPRLSMPLDEDDDDSFHEHPPRLSMPLEEENITQHSVERPRRAWDERRRDGFGESFVSVPEVDDNALGTPSLGGFNDLPRVGRETYSGFDEDADMVIDDDLDTRTLRQSFLQDSPGRQSDVQPAPFAEQDEDTTFFLTVPQPDLQPDISSSPAQVPDDLDEESVVRPEPISDQLDQSSDDALGDPHYELPYERPGLPQTRGSPLIVQSEKAKEQVKKVKEIKRSRHGTIYPSFPAGVVKRLVSTFSTPASRTARPSKETMSALMQATDWFFEQVSEDLGAYAKHAGRKTIEESDMITLMKRQRQISTQATPFSLAQRYLPRELLQNMRMAPPPKARRKQGTALMAIQEEDDEV